MNSIKAASVGCFNSHSEFSNKLQVLLDDVGDNAVIKSILISGGFNARFR